LTTLSMTFFSHELGGAFDAAADSDGTAAKFPEGRR
jgi:hypothetical protein